MALSNAAYNTMADALGAKITHVGLLTSDSSSAEVTGGSPAYARQPISWNAASGGNLDSANTPIFDVPAGTTITFVGYFSAATGGTYYGSSPINAETFGSQGEYELQDADIVKV